MNNKSRLIANATIILLIGFIVRLLVTTLNAFYGPVFGADLDALAFHERAVEYSQNSTLETFEIGWIYSYVLGLIYSITADSLFLGGFLSCFAWLLSAKYLVKITKLLRLSSKNQFWVLIIYALLPSSILYTSVTLRESYQLLFVTVAIYSCLMILINKSFSYWGLLLFSIFFAGILHGALMAYGMFLIVLVFMYSSYAQKTKSGFTMILMACTIFTILYFAMSVFNESAYQLSNGLGSAIEKYQTGGLNVVARANYKSEVTVSNTIDLLLFIPLSLFQYLFEPMPWRLIEAVDIPLIFENMLRFWLIYKVLTNIRSRSIINRRLMFFLFISYLALETIWSVGTINWGTASRHHLLSIGILLVAAFHTTPGKKMIVK